MCFLSAHCVCLLLWLAVRLSICLSFILDDSKPIPRSKQHQGGRRTAKTDKQRTRRAMTNRRSDTSTQKTRQMCQGKKTEGSSPDTKGAEDGAGNGGDGLGRAGLDSTGPFVGGSPNYLSRSTCLRKKKRHRGNSFSYPASFPD